MSLDRYAIGNSSPCTCGAECFNSGCIPISGGYCGWCFDNPGGITSWSVTFDVMIGGSLTYPLTWNGTFFLATIYAPGTDSGFSWTYIYVAVYPSPTAPSLVVVFGLDTGLPLGEGVEHSFTQCNPLTVAIDLSTYTNIFLWQGESALHYLGASLATITGPNANYPPACWPICVTCPDPIPSTLSVTDTLGTFTATWNPTLSLWLTPQLCASESGCAGCVYGAASCAGAGFGYPLYWYGIACTGIGTMGIVRYYMVVNCSGTYYYATCDCAGGTETYVNKLYIPVTCGSIAWSGALNGPGSPLPDPVGGTTSFTQ